MGVKNEDKMKEGEYKVSLVIVGYRAFTACSGTKNYMVGTTSTGFPLGLENLEKWDGIFQSGKSQGIQNTKQIVKKTGNFVSPEKWEPRSTYDRKIASTKQATRV